MAAPSRMLLKRLCHLCNRSWIRCFSTPPGSGQDGETFPGRDPKKGLFGKLQNRYTKPDSEIISDPVRNTEREYYETHLNPDWEGHQRSAFESRFYSKKHGVSQDFMAWLHWDININDDLLIQSLLKKRTYTLLKKDQKYLNERTAIVGRELGAAHFVVARGGRVKFVGRDVWFMKDDKGQYGLPRVKIDNMFLEAIDASDTNLTYVAFDNFVGLSKLRFMKFHNCAYIDDWCLARLQRLKDSLEYLDISDCPGITDNGLISLQCLQNLKVLRVSKLPQVKYLGLITLLLEEQLPDLMVLGVTDDDLKPPEWSHRGESRLVQALLALAEEESAEEANEDMKEIGNAPQEELKRYVRKVDS